MRIGAKMKARGRLARSRSHWFVGLSAVVSSLILLVAQGVAAQTSVYRCTTPSGEIEFRQQACTQGTNEQEITIEDRKTGWEAPKPVANKKKDSKKSNGGKKGKSKSKKKAKSDVAKQEEKCWRKRQQIEDVEAKLRQGYSVKEGNKLHRKLEKYEDYVRTFCDKEPIVGGRK